MLYPSLVCSSLGDGGGSGHYRVLYPLLAGDMAGQIQLRMPNGFYFFDIETIKRLKPDAILFHRSHTKGQYKYISEIKDKTDALIVYTIDDWVERVPKESPHYAEMPENVGREIRKVIKLCDRLIVTNDLLKMVYGTNKETHVIPNYLPARVWEAAYGTAEPHPKREGRKFRIGWSGGMGHPGDLKILREIADILGDSVQWVFMGMTPPGFTEHNSEIHASVMPKDYPVALHNLHLDLALAPLLDNEFNRAKSNLRLLEYGACGYSVIASDVRPYQDCDLVNLLPYKATAWADLIKLYMKDPSILDSVGLAMKEWVWNTHKLEDHVTEYTEILAPDHKGFQPQRIELDKTVDVVITAYNQKPLVEKCIESIEASRNKTPYEVIVVDDGSTDPEAKAYLNQLRIMNKATLITLEKNQGYVTAVNAGLLLHQNRDIIILNSDTEVNGDWLDRLQMAAYSRQDYASITPFSNAGSIVSYPTLEKNPLPDLKFIDDIISETIAAPVNIPTPVGFCTYIKRAALAQLGLFDAHAFGRGYGEENEWAMRAMKFNWLHGAAANVFVLHKDSGTFGAQKQELSRVATEVLTCRWPSYAQIVQQWHQKDLLQNMRTRFDIAVLAKRASNNRVAFIAHQLGGGVDIRLQQIIHDQFPDSVVFRCDPRTAYGIKLEAPGNYHNLPVIDIRADMAQMIPLFEMLKIKQIKVESLVGHDYATPEWLKYLSEASGIPYDVTLHDYYPICPRICLVDSTFEYCGEPEVDACNKCIATNNSIIGHVNVADWRGMYKRFLHGARKVVAPSKDVIYRYNKHFPELQIELETDHYTSNIRPSAVPYESGTLKVLVLGYIALQKGARVVVECAKYCAEHNLPIEFIVCGSLPQSDTDGLSNLKITGVYHEPELPELLEKLQCNIAFLPSVCPETYSITLSHVFKARLYPIVFDIGALAERVKEKKFGTVIPFERNTDIEYVVNCLWEHRYGDRNA